ncbi:MAG: hypothetical protein ABII96_08275 [Candidatus Zixiibacteriota bacterium]
MVQKMDRGTERKKLEIASMFAKVVALVCVISLLAMIGFKVINPQSDITPFLHVFLISFGYLVGNINNILGA